MLPQITIALCGLVLATAGFSQAPGKEPQPASISGKVLNSVTGEAVDKAAIILRSPEAAASAYGVLTSSDGSFKLSDLEPGTYDISVEKKGYASARPAKRGNRNLMNVSLLAGQELTGLEFQLVPAGVVAGHLFGVDGEPMAGAALQLLPSKGAASRSGSFASHSVTNDLGEYRLFQVPPGHYYLKATYADVFERQNVKWQRPAATKPSTPETYVPTYYPGAVTESQAGVVVVKPGGVLQGLDFALLRSRTVRVRGRVVVAALQPQLIFVSLVGTDQGIFRHAVPDRKGAFEFTGVAPGSYVLSAAVPIPGALGVAGGRALEVGDSDVDGIELDLYSQVEIRGRIRMEESGDKIPSGLIVLLAPREARPTSGAGEMSQVAADGSFALQGTHGAKYDVVIGSLTKSDDNAYIKAATLGDTDVLSEGLEFPAGESPAVLDIILTSKGAAVDCDVSSAGESVAGSLVILIPEKGRRSQAHLYGECKTNQQGRCSITGVAPGSYSLFAFDADSAPRNYRTGDAFAPYEKSGKAITLNQQERQQVRLDLIEEP